jgi:DNA topoisomerase-2
MSRIDLDKYSDDDIIKVLKLEESETEIYNTLDEHGNLKIFESVTDIIKYFVNFRLTFYQKRKDFILNRLQQELKVLSQKGKFIKLILDGKIIVNNQPKDKIISQIETNGLEKIDDSYDYLLRLPIYSLTKEVFEKLKEDFTHKKEEIKGVELWTPNGMYLEDLQELKKKLK